MDNNTIIKASALAVGGVAVGGVGGYFLAMKRLEAKYAALADEEINSVKEQYRRTSIKEKFNSPTDAMIEMYGTALRDDIEIEERTEAAEESVQEELELDAITPMDVEEVRQMTDRIEAGRKLARTLSGVKIKTSDAGYPVVSKAEQSIWETPQPSDEELRQDQWEADQIAMRDSMTPYWITVEDYANGSKGFDQMTLTYYEGDNTLCNEKEEMIDDIDGVIGEINLNYFGRGCKEEHLVYVRNEVISTDFEIIRVEGYYAALVLGLDEDTFEPETRRPRVRKPRDDRDS